MDDALRSRLLEPIAHLARTERLPGSPGEREAAEWIAARLRDLGLEAEVEEERVHGSYIGPVLCCTVPAAVAGAAPGRRPAALLGLAGLALLWQDLSGGPRRWLRRRLPQHPTWTTVAAAGPRDAVRTIVVHAHHDAARTSPIFDQTVPTAFAKAFPGLHARMDRWPPLMWLVLAGPGLVGLGAALGLRRVRRTGTVVAAGTAAVMGHMRTQPVVPGANDNLTGVAVVLELARRLAADPPPPGTRVVLASVGSEESNQDGMLRFMERHGGELAHAEFVCLDTVGSPELVLIEGEGFVRMREYDPGVKGRLEAAAARAGVPLRRGLHFTFATDALAPLRRGLPVATLASVNAATLPSNYHWPTDTADRVDLTTVADAAAVVEGYVRDA